jgi:outer membrane biosynthesis protein TonB
LPSDPKIADVTFRINSDGSITNVKVVKGNVSAELARYIAQAFANLPRVKNVPKSIGASQFQVQLAIGV